MLASSFGPNYRPETGNSEPQASRFGSASVSETSNSSTVVSSWANVIPVPMPVPLAPYPAPQPHVPIPPPSPQSQIICIGCRTLLVYPHGAANVRCALCSSVTAVPPGSEMAQLVCGGCRTLLMYVRGASSVQCSCCHTINYAMEGNQMAHVNCGGCNMMLMYAYGAQSVKCALCHFVTTIPAMGFEQMNGARMPVPMQRPSFPPQPSATSVPAGRPQAQTVYVENPMTLDESGKLVSNVAVGVATEKK